LSSIRALAAKAIMSNSDVMARNRMMAGVITSLRRRLGLRSSIASDFLGRAHLLVGKGQHEKAVEAIEAGLAVRPNHMLAHETLIQLLVHLRRYEQALNACARALELDAQSAGVLASLSAILPTVRHTERPDEVIQALNRCLAASPDHFEVLILLTELLSKLRRFREVVQACERALEIDPEFFPAAEIIENTAKDPAARHELAGMQLMAKSRPLDEYNRLAAGNVACLLSQVMTTFYTKLGVDAQTTPLMQGLDRFRRKLTMKEVENVQVPSMPVLVPFERAWAQYQSGAVDEALRVFETIFRDASARKRAAFNPYVKEAVVRAGEILGRHYDNLGNVDLSISVYREILELDHNSLIAGRLLLLLSRSGNLRAAAELAERAIISRPNLYPRLRENSYIASLKEEISSNEGQGRTQPQNQTP
jgi:tetratricopeptide (TPR) repeat protein